MRVALTKPRVAEYLATNVQYKDRNLTTRVSEDVDFLHIDRHEPYHMTACIMPLCSHALATMSARYV
jgi:hypothetical protein